MHDEDVWVIECGGRAGFLLKAAQPISVFRKISWQDFDRDFAIQASIAGAIDFTHPTRAEWGENFIRPKLITCHNGHQDETSGVDLTCSDLSTYCLDVLT